MPGKALRLQVRGGIAWRGNDVLDLYLLPDLALGSRKQATDIIVMEQDNQSRSNDEIDHCGDADPSNDDKDDATDHGGQAPYN